VKRYAVESSSAAVRRWLSTGTVATSRLSEIEVASALTRRARDGAFSMRERDRALAALVADIAAIHVVELLPAVTVKARGLLLRHPLRANDAAQLASCLFLQQELGEAVSFVVFDERLRAAALVEGLGILPET
jgi:predicted nucleic acid-binding protein